MALPKITRHIGIVFFKYNEDYNCPIFRDSKLAVLEHCPRNLIQVFHRVSLPLNQQMDLS